MQFIIVQLGAFAFVVEDCATHARSAVVRSAIEAEGVWASLLLRNLMHS